MDISTLGGSTLEQVHSLVKRILKSWTGYQLGIKNQSGGSQTAEKDKWFAEELAIYLTDRPDDTAMELEEWMEEILNAEFDLIFEDNSVRPTAQSMLDCAKWIRTSNGQALADFIDKLPSEEQIQTAASQSTTTMNEEEDSSSSGSEDDEDESMQTEETSVRQKLPRTVTGDDGWTTIVPKRQ